MRKDLIALFKKSMALCCGLGLASGLVFAKPSFAESSVPNNGAKAASAAVQKTSPAGQAANRMAYSLDYGAPAGPQGVVPTLGKGVAVQNLAVFENKGGTLQKVNEIAQGSEIQILTTTHFAQGSSLRDTVLTAADYAQIQLRAKSQSASKFLFPNNKNFAVVRINGTSFMVPLSGVSLGKGPATAPSASVKTPDGPKTKIPLNYRVFMP